MFKIFLLIIGIILSSVGLSFIILYLNLMVMNYSFIEYLIYILTHLSTNIFFIGIIIIYLSIK